jgi:hypothetical protein
VLTMDCDGSHSPLPAGVLAGAAHRPRDRIASSQAAASPAAQAPAPALALRERRLLLRPGATTDRHPRYRRQVRDGEPSGAARLLPQEMVYRVHHAGFRIAESPSSSSARRLEDRRARDLPPPGVS